MNPDRYLDELRRYLAGDATMHYTWIDASTGQTRSKLDKEWLTKHYVNPIRNVLARSAAKHPPDEAALRDWEARKKAAEAQGHTASHVDPAYQKLKFETDTKVSFDTLNNTGKGRAELTRIDFSGPTPQPRCMATLFTIIDAHNWCQDEEGMLPVPYCGMTKTAGGRAQRYMCHGHRTRIQVMVHTFDIFPNKRLGLAMCDAIQEGFRASGFDEVERSTTGHGLKGEWMDNWVDQVYISTKDFVPLLQSALQTQEEWVRLLTKEQRDPQRTAGQNATGEAETDAEYQARLDESPTDTLERVIGHEVVQCFRKALDVWIVHDRNPTADDMPETEYPNMHKWLISHVNRAPAIHLRYLRHSNQNGNERAVRDYVQTLCRNYLRAEVAAQGNQGTALCDRFESMVDELDDALDKSIAATPEGAALLAEEHDKNVKQVEDSFMGKLPLPRYSAVHAPGGDLEARDRAEDTHYQEALKELLAGRDTIRNQYELNFGKGMAVDHKKTKKETRHNRLLDAATRMRDEGEETDGGPDKYFGYKASTITKWIKWQGGGGPPPPRRRRARTPREHTKRRETADTVTPAALHKISQQYPGLEDTLNQYATKLERVAIEEADANADAESVADRARVDVGQRMSKIRRFFWLNMRASEKYPEQWALDPSERTDAMRLMKNRVAKFKTGGAFEAFAFDHPCDDESGGLPWAYPSNTANGHTGCSDQASIVQSFIDFLEGNGALIT